MVIRGMIYYCYTNIRWFMMENPSMDDLGVLRFSGDLLPGLSVAVVQGLLQLVKAIHVASGHVGGCFFFPRKDVKVIELSFL